MLAAALLRPSDADDDGSGAAWCPAPRRRACARSLPELALALLLLIGGFVADAVPPCATYFSERDPSISKPRLDETVSEAILVVACFVLPGALLLAVELRSGRERCAAARAAGEAPPARARPSAWLLLALCEALGAAHLATSLAKSASGSLRPNAMALCDYQGFASASASGDPASSAWVAFEAATRAGAPGNFALCRGPLADVQEARRGFPSGHASSAFAGLGVLFLGLRAAAGARGFFSLRAAACAAPLALASFIAVSRLVDLWHTEAQVVGGTVLGLASAAVAWENARLLGRVPPPLALLCPPPPPPAEEGEGSAS
jgi:membrane-associated phospholipid phosphatase